MNDTSQQQDRDPQITVFLLDDHEVVRRGLRDLLAGEPDIAVVGEAGTVASALPRVLDLRPGVAVLDVRLPDGDGVSVCREIRSALSGTICLMLTSYGDDQALFRAVMAGAAGYVLKETAGPDLVSAVRTVASGGSMLDAGMVQRMIGKLREQPAADPLSALSDQEKRVLELIGEGLTNRQIAQRLSLAEQTVKGYVSSLLTKLGVQRRTQAAAFAARPGADKDDLRQRSYLPGPPARSARPTIQIFLYIGGPALNLCLAVTHCGRSPGCCFCEIDLLIVTALAMVSVAALPTNTPRHHRATLPPFCRSLEGHLASQKAGSRSGLSSATSRMRVPLATVIRFLVHPISRVLRGRLRWLPRWYEGVRPAPRIEDWSSPLLMSRSPAAGMPRNSPADLTAPTDLTGVAGSGLTPEARTGPHRPAPLRAPGPAGSGMSATRCLLVTSMLNVGGLEEVVATLARRLPEFGIHTAVLDVQSHPSSNGQPRGYLGQVLRDGGIEVHETDEARADSWISRWRPDVLSAHGPLPSGVLASANHLSVPYIETLHGMHDLFGADWRAEAARAAKMSAIVSVSELVRLQYLAGNPGFPSARIVTIPNGVDEDRRRGGDRARARERLGACEEYVFVSLARHCLQKNTYGLLTAFSDLARHHPGAHLIVAGKLVDPRYSRRVLRLRDGLACRDRIHLRSHLADPASLLAAADGFVLNSFFEGWPLASMEALFAGLPVVIGDVGGAREQMGSDPTRGYLVSNPLGDSLRVDWESMRTARYRTQANRDELVTAMQRLVDDRQDYLSNRALLAAESAARFSADTCLARHAAVLRAVANGADLPELVDVPSP